MTGITIGNHAASATFTLPDVGPAEDIDLFVAYDTGGGNFQVVGSSTGPAGANESVTLVAPPAGNYQVWVYGFQVSAADAAAGNTVGVDIVQGNDLTVTGLPVGPVPANTPVTLHVTLRERGDVAEPVRGPAPARPGRGSDGGNGADHDQRRAVSARIAGTDARAAHSGGPRRFGGILQGVMRGLITSCRRRRRRSCRRRGERSAGTERLARPEVARVVVRHRVQGRAERRGDVHRRHEAPAPHGHGERGRPDQGGVRRRHVRALQRASRSSPAMRRSSSARARRRAAVRC